MWSNDHPGAQRPRHRWSAFAEGTDRLELGVAVMALDRHEPGRDQRAGSTDLGLDRDRLWIGVGAGFSSSR